MANRKVYMNGKFVDECEAKVSIFDSSLMFGDMVFEMTRSFNGEHFKLKEHIDRLFMGLKILRIELPESKEDVYNLCIKTAQMNQDAFNEDDETKLQDNNEMNLQLSTVKELKLLAKNYGISNRGNKEELIKRITNHLVEKN